jgi:hypothetical protein
MFDQSRILVEQYYCALLTSGKASKLAEHLLHEVRGRLRSLQWTHHRLVQLDAKLDATGRARSPESQPVVLKQIFSDGGRPDCTTHRHAQLPFEIQDEVRVLLESFYYSAHRVRDILRDGREALPGVASFEAVGVRNVRNHLVEHPSKKGGVLVPSIATGGPVGPQLKPLRWSLDESGTHDAGLHANAAEFATAFDASMSAGIVALVSNREHR